MSTSCTKKPSWLRGAYLGVSLALAGGLLFYSLNGIDLAGVLHTVVTASPSWIAAMSLVTVGSMFLRSLRWRVLLLAQGEVPVATAFWATAAGYFGNNFLPARAGEFVRTFMVSSQCMLSKAYVLTTALSERVADAVILVVISSGVLLFLKSPPGWLSQAARPFAILGLCGIAAIALLPRLEWLYRGVLAKLPLPGFVGPTLNHILDEGVLGIRSFHNSARLARFVVFTLVIWSCDVLAIVLAARALRMSISLPVAFLLIAGLGLGSALPSTPGYIGIYQFVAVGILTPFAFSRANAIAFSFFIQAVQYVIIGILGLAGIIQYNTLRKRAYLNHVPAVQ